MGKKSIKINNQIHIKIRHLFHGFIQISPISFTLWSFSERNQGPMVFFFQHPQLEEFLFHLLEHLYFYEKLEVNCC